MQAGNGRINKMNRHVASINVEGLKEFKKNRKCPVCSHKKSITQYIPTGNILTIWGMNSINEGEPVMERSCQTCHHIWYEKPKMKEE